MYNDYIPNRSGYCVITYLHHSDVTATDDVTIPSTFMSCIHKQSTHEQNRVYYID